METTPEVIREKMTTPAILLMVAAGLNIAITLISAATSLVPDTSSSTAMLDFIQDSDQREQLRELLENVGSKGGAMASVLWAFFQALKNAFTLAGGYFMLRGQSYPLALAGAIVGCIPCCECCCFLTMGASIWCLVVLNQPQVKAAFSTAPLMP